METGCGWIREDGGVIVPPEPSILHNLRHTEGGTLGHTSPRKESRRLTASV